MLLRGRFALDRIHFATQSGSSSSKSDMNTQANLPNMLKQPSAFVPMTMSLLAVAILLNHIARFGTAPQVAEGTSAHLWQLLMGLQIPIIVFFAIRWLPQSPRSASFILALQAAAGIAALAPVYFLHW